ncbi:hypothetical protein ACLOJK_041702 [Asimina triloba]
MGRSEPLFETKEARGRIAYKMFAISVFAGVCMIWAYRVTHLPKEGSGGVVRFVLGSHSSYALEARLSNHFQGKTLNELDKIHNPLYFPFDNFSNFMISRYEDDELPGADIFVCTADPKIEPPILVINTILSVMAYDYPPEKLCVYLSDDAGSILTFYALLEASQFTKHWIPFCRKFKVDPTSPADLYEKMENRIEMTVKLGRAPKEIQGQHKGFSKWNSAVSSSDHQAILQILIDGRDPTCVDAEGSPLPTLVYLAREKRPQCPHNFKAGALNALIRVSSVISNGPIIVTVDCDMYSNNTELVRDMLCFFMDGEKGHEIGYVQTALDCDNLPKNDVYCHSNKVTFELEFNGMDGCGGPPYAGSGTFLRRESLCGNKYSEGWKGGMQGRANGSVQELVERGRALAMCTSEANTQWGKEMGLKYGCPVEDIITGLGIHCRGWKSIYFNPTRKAFLGVAPTTLEQTLVQQKRWAEGHLQILVTKHCPFIQGHGKIKLGLQMCYVVANAWAVNAIPTLFYALIPSLALLNHVHMFPRVTSPWSLPFFYVILATCAYGLGEALWFGETFRSWWYQQRIWLYKRLASYLFATIDTALYLLGLANTTFLITAKDTHEEVAQRYEQEMIEFGSNSPMFTVLATVAMVNLFCFLGAIKRVMFMGNVGVGEADALVVQWVLCGALVIINWPIYEGLFLRKDNGRLPPSVAFQSIGLAVLACLLPVI